MLHDEVPEFFDSFGRDPTKNEFKIALKEFSDVKFSVMEIQSCFTDVCGIYCCLYSLFKCLRISMELFLDQFDDSLIKNDLKAVEMFKIYFSNI